MAGRQWLNSPGPAGYVYLGSAIAMAQ